MNVRAEIVLALGVVFAAAVPVNFAWEMGQAALYGPMGSFWTATWRCFLASLGDGAMLVLVAIAGWLSFGTATWFTRAAKVRYVFAATAGLLFAVIIEWWGLRTGRWEYDARMVVVPGTRLGVVPLVQMVLLAPVSFWLARAWLVRRAGVARGGPNP
jgi:hypothetical protein